MYIAVEEIQCLATWAAGHHFFLVALVRDNRYYKSFGDRYRCILYEKRMESLAINEQRVREPQVLGYKMAISAEPTCHGLFDSSMGEKMLVLSNGSIF